MNPVDGLLLGFSVLFTPANLFAVVSGSLIGTLIGVLPGIGPVSGMAIALSAVSAFSGPETGLIMLAGIYYGAMYGGSTTSILLNVPGEAASIVTCIEGNQMARKGRGGAALAVAAVSSFFAGTIGIVGLMLFAPALASYALAFGPPEFFALLLLGIIALTRLSGRSFWRSLFMLSFGLLLASVGMDAVTGINRYAFGNVDLSGGIELVPVIMGLYGLSEMLLLSEKLGTAPRVIHVKFREMWPNRQEWRRSWGPIFRASGIGFTLGVLPGPSAVLSTFLSYRLENRISKHPEEFGHGAIEGVAGPEAANNAASSGAMIPLLALGIPWGAITTLLLAALMIQGVQPGPLLIKDHPEIFWAVVASMYLGNVVLLILNLPLVGLWVSILRVPETLIIAAVLAFMFVGAYSVNNAMFDVYVMIIFGVIGYFLKKLQFELVPIVLAMVLGPLIENAFRQSLFISRGSFMIFLERPITVTLLACIVIILILPLVAKLVARRQGIVLPTVASEDV